MPKKNSTIWKLICQPLPNDNEQITDKIYLPSSILNHLEDTLADSSPLIFRMTHGQQSVCCGVREFSQSEGIAMVPRWMLEALEIEEGEEVSLEQVELPKGTFAQLHAEDSQHSMSSKVGDIRSLLESFMRSQLTALSVGQTIRVPAVSGVLSFRVTELEPQEQVDIVDTDLSVDITYPTLESEENVTGISHLQPNMPVKIDIGKRQKSVYQVQVPSGVERVGMELECRSGIANLFASSIDGQVDETNNDWHDYSPPSQTLKHLEISGSQSLYVAVVSTEAGCQGVLRVEFDRKVPSQEISEGDTKLCDNCGKMVPRQRFDIHQMRCERIIVKCPQCQQPFLQTSTEWTEHWHCPDCTMHGQATDKDHHQRYFHTPANCPSCNSEFPSISSLAEHRRTDCPSKLIECRYCHNLVPQGDCTGDTHDLMEGLRSHESYCGNRTIECVKCKQNVRIRQVKLHMQMHGMQEQDRLNKMVRCTNRECSRERSGDNPLGLCGTCFGPLYTGLYDPDHQKLLKRLARCLHTQMTKGCGNSGCKNAGWCASARQQVWTGTEAAAMMVPVLKALAPISINRGVDFKRVGLHLCV